MNCAVCELPATERQPFCRGCWDRLTSCQVLSLVAAKDRESYQEVVRDVAADPE